MFKVNIKGTRTTPGGTLCCNWMKDLERYSYFAGKLIKWYVEGEIDLRDIGLDCTEVNF